MLFRVCALYTHNPASFGTESFMTAVRYTQLSQCWNWILHDGCTLHTQNSAIGTGFFMTAVHYTYNPAIVGTGFFTTAVRYTQLSHWN